MTFSPNVKAENAFYSDEVPADGLTSDVYASQ